MQSHIHSVGTSRCLFLEQVRLCQEPHWTEAAEPSAGETTVWKVGRGGGGKVWIPPHSLRGHSNAEEPRGVTMILQLMGN